MAGAQRGIAPELSRELIELREAAFRAGLDEGRGEASGGGVAALCLGLAAGFVVGIVVSMAAVLL